MLIFSSENKNGKDGFNIFRLTLFSRQTSNLSVSGAGLRTYMSWVRNVGPRPELCDIHPECLCLSRDS